MLKEQMATIWPTLRPCGTIMPYLSAQWPGVRLSLCEPPHYCTCCWLQVHSVVQRFVCGLAPCPPRIHICYLWRCGTGLAMQGSSRSCERKDILPNPILSSSQNWYQLILLIGPFTQFLLFSVGEGSCRVPQAPGRAGGRPVLHVHTALASGSHHGGTRGLQTCSPQLTQCLWSWKVLLQIHTSLELSYKWTL